MMKNEIGINAGIIWQLLFRKSPLSIKELEKDTNLKDCDLNLAIGWLARENKIIITEENGSRLIGLMHNSPDQYY